MSAAYAINDGVRKAVEVEFAIFATDFGPTSRFGHDSAQRTLKLIQEVIAEVRLPLFIPQRGGFQFFGGFRMADDAHGACSGYPGQPSPLGGN